METYLRQNVAAWERAVSVAVGAVLIARAARRHGTLASGLAGAALVSRGATGFCPVYAATGLRSRSDDTRVALGGSRGTHLRGCITIQVEPEEVFGFWHRLENLPMFVTNLESVERLDERQSRWTVRGPAGVRVSWDAEIINEIEDELIAWRSLPGSDVVSAGSVHFRPLLRGGTEVDVTMQYALPGGHAGAAVGWLFGRGTTAELQDDLRRLKQLLETGEIARTDDRAAGRRSKLFRVAQRVTT